VRGAFGFMKVVWEVCDGHEAVLGKGFDEEIGRRGGGEGVVVEATVGGGGDCDGGRGGEEG